MGAISRTAKRPKRPRDRAYKTNVATEIDFSDLEHLAAADDVELVRLSGTALAQLSLIAGAPLTYFKQQHLNEIVTDYFHQKKQWTPSKSYSRWQLQSLAHVVCASDAGEIAPDNTAVLVAQLNSLAFSRLAHALRAHPELPRGRAAGEYVFDRAANPVLLGEAAVVAARYKKRGDYSDATVHLTVQRLTYLYEQWSGRKAKYSHKARADYSTFARSEAARFVECFFEHAAPALPSQTALSSLSRLLTKRKKAAARIP